MNIASIAARLKGAFGFVTAEQSVTGGIGLSAGDIVIDPAPRSIRTAVRSADTAANATALVVPFRVEAPAVVDRVSGTVAVKQAGALVEIGIYSAARQRIVTTERRECPEVGTFEFAIPRTQLQQGDYFAVLYCNHATPTFGVETRPGRAFTATGALPLTSALSSLTPGKHAPALQLHFESDVSIAGFAEVSNGGIRVFGNSGVQAWGMKSNHMLCYTNDGGITWLDFVTRPSASTIYDIQISGGKCYVLTANNEIFQSSNLTQSATWVDISPPVSAGLRRSVAQSRPYGMAVVTDYVVWGEYSGAVDLTADPSDPAPPRILKYGPLSGTPTWSLSKQFDTARHTHSFLVDYSNRLWVSVGDAGYGAEIGIWRTTDITNNSSWQKWTSPTAPFSNHYPVDFLYFNPGVGCDDGLFMTSDRPGYHLLFTKAVGSPGAFNISPQAFPSVSLPGETVRSLTLDPATRNLYYITAETEDPAVYVSPAPYVKSYRLGPIADLPFRTKGVITGNFFMIYDRRFTLAKFPWQV